MKVQHKRSGNIAEVISNDGKRVVVKDVAKGEETELAISTFKRWWKQLDVDEKKEEVESPLTEVSKEILETAKKKAKAKRKSTAKTSVDRSKKSSKTKDDVSVISVIEKLAKDNGFIIKRKSDIAAQYKFADSPAMFGTVVYKNYVTLYCRSRYVDETILRQMTHLKSSFDVNIKISSDSLNIAKQIISECVDYNKSNKKAKTTKKEEK